MMSTRLQAEAGILSRRLNKINAAPDVPLVRDRRKHLDAALTTISSRAKTCRDMQKQIAGIMGTIEGGDFSIVKGDEQTPLEYLALQRLGAVTGARRVRRMSDGKILRPRFLDRHYQGPDRRPGYYIFSTRPAPGVYFMGRDAENIETAYTPEESK